MPLLNKQHLAQRQFHIHNFQKPVLVSKQEQQQMRQSQMSGFLLKS
jgi:hypothetical protein